MTTELLNELYQKGLIQFGRFSDLGEVRHIQFHFDLLPSYPQLLAEVAQYISVGVAHSHLDYVLASYDAIPLGTYIATHLDIPVLYQLKHETTPPNRIVGSYDVGHPVLLITNMLDDLEGILSDAVQVGLDIVQVSAIVGELESVPNHKTETLFDMNDVRLLQESIL